MAAVSPRNAVALAVISGGLYYLAFPPMDLGGFGFVALVPLLLAVRAQPRWRALLLGWLMGTVAAYTLVAAPIFEAASRFLPDRPWVPWFLALGIPQVYGAFYFALFGICAREVYARRLGTVAEAMALAAAWTACEFLRARVGEGCPWNLLAHSQHARLWMLQVADLGGAAAVTFVVAGVNAALAQIALPGAEPRTRVRAAGVAVGLLLLARLYGAAQLAAWAQPEGDAMRVALVQGNVPDEWRYSLRHVPDAMRRLLDLTATARSDAPLLVIWPENAISVSVADNQRLFAPLAGQLPPASRLLVGAPRAASDGAGGASLRNSAYLLDEHGRTLEVYDKLRLTPYGESLPTVVGAFVAEAETREGRYMPGDRWTVFEVGAHRFATVICWEAIYAPLVRQFVRAGAQFLVNISNDGWFGAQPSLEQHFNAALLRAVETRRFLLRATNAGITAVIDPRGAVVAQAPRAEATTLVTTIVPIGAQTLYTKAGDLFAWVCLASVAFVVFISRRLCQ